MHQNASALSILQYRILYHWNVWFKLVCCTMSNNFFLSSNIFIFTRYKVCSWRACCVRFLGYRIEFVINKRKQLVSNTHEKIYSRSVCAWAWIKMLLKDMTLIKEIASRPLHSLHRASSLFAIGTSKRKWLFSSSISNKWVSWRWYVGYSRIERGRHTCFLSFSSHDYFKHHPTKRWHVSIVAYDFLQNFCNTVISVIYIFSRHHNFSRILFAWTHYCKPLWRYYLKYYFSPNYQPKPGSAPFESSWGIYT